MKTKTMNRFIKNYILTIALATVILSLSSCATKVPFLTSSVVPAARGIVKLSTDKNNNYVITLEVSNLAEPNRLQPPGNTYMVRLVTDDNYTRNIGQIEETKKLKASLETVSSSKPIKVFITTEDDPSTQYPSTVVLTTGNL